MRKKALLISFVIGNLLLVGFTPTSTYTTPLNAESQTLETTTTDIDAYGEFSNLYIGKDGAGIFTLTTVGHNIQLPINPSWDAVDGLKEMHLGTGIGHRWWLYYHRDIFPEIPPTISLSLRYRPELSESTAISQANTLVNKLNETLGVELHPFWSQKTRKGTLVTFARGYSQDFIADFMKEETLSRFPQNGLSNLLKSNLIDENLAKARYTRSALSIRKDFQDIDQDGDIDEFVPRLFFGTVVPQFVQRKDEWFHFSLKDALQTPQSVETIEPHPHANISSVNVHFPIPIEVDRTRSSIPDNPMFEYKGKLHYLLKRGNYTRNMSDINVYFDLLNMTKELNTIPIVTGSFFIKAGTGGSYNYKNSGIKATDITFQTVLKNNQEPNNGDASARDMEVSLPFPKRFIKRIHYMQEWFHNKTNKTRVLLDPKEFISSDDWNLSRFTVEHSRRYGLRTHIDSLPAGENVTLRFNLTIFPRALFGLFSGEDRFAIHFPMGPLFHYHDAHNRRYSGFANGFAFIMKDVSDKFLNREWNVSSTVGVQMPTEPKVIDRKQLKMRFNFTVPVFSRGTNAIKDVKVDLFRARSKGYYGYQDRRKMDSARFEKIKNEWKIARMSFTERLKVGQWLSFSRIKYDVFGIEDITLYTNSFSMYVPPVEWLTDRWRQQQQYPYPHVELELNKGAFLNVTSNRMHISLNITNRGDIPTKITVYERILTDYVNTSVGDNGIVDVKVDGTSVMDSEKINVIVRIKEDLGVVWVKIEGIKLNPGSTKQIEIIVATKEETTNVSLHGTVIEYNFGKFAPEEADTSDKDMNDSSDDSADTLSANTAMSQREKLKVLGKFHTLTEDDDHSVSTSSNTIPVVSLVAPETDGGDGFFEDGGRGLFSILAVGTIVGLIATTVYFLARRKKSVSVSVE